MSHDDDALLNADGAARRAALARESIIVEAPAGAGKTELLTQRFLALLPTVQDPEEIVALTFTNKAAAEMRARIVDSLALAASGQRPGDDQPHKQITYDLGRQVLAADEARDWGLRYHPGRLQVTTLDALCGKLARQMPFLSRFGAQPAVSADAAPLYRQAARNTLDMLEDDGEETVAAQEVLTRVLTYFDNDARKVQSLLEAMLATRDQWLGHIHGQHHDSGPSRTALASLVNDELAAIATALPPALQQAMMAAARYAGDMARQNGGADNVANLLDWTRPLAGHAEELPRWRGLGELLLTRTGTLRSRFDPTLKLSEKDVKPLAEALKDVIATLKQSASSEAQLARIGQLPDPQPGEDEWQLIADFALLLTLASAQLWLVFLEQRQVDFIEVAQNALAALGSSEAPSELREKLDYRLSHLLVDEFQDTSPVQVRLLEQLTADWQAEDGRTLFLVGDPMQSIYRFRKADVGLFLKVRERGIGGIRLKPLRLYRNNRSQRQLVAWVNATFPSVFAAADDPRRGAVRFAPAAPTLGSAPEAGVWIHPVVDGADGEMEEEGPMDHREARQIISLLRQTRREDPNGSIAVLVRARSHLQALVSELRQEAADLRYQAVEIEALDQRQAVQDLLSLTRALHHRADRVHWLAVLRAPWCGLTLADLHVLAGDDHRRTIWQLMQDDARLGRLSDDGRQRLGHVRAVLAEAFAHHGQHRPRRWVEGVWQCLGGPLCLRDDNDALDVEAFLTLLDGAESQGSLDLEQLAEDMAKLYAAPDPAGGAIQLMTVHKSKGLEFDTVILPGLHRPLRGNDRPLLVWEQVLLDDGDEHLVVAPLPRKKTDKSGPPSRYDYLLEFEKQRAQHESQRLLYVAATRAKRQLHLFGAVSPSGKEGEICRPPAKNAALALLWPAIGGEFEAAVTSREEKIGDDATVAPPFTPRLERLAAPAIATALGIPPGAVKADAGNDELDAATASHSLEADIGILVHRYLELIADDDPARWPSTRLAALTEPVRRWLLARGHGPAAAQQGTQTVLRNLGTTLDSTEGRWLLRARPGSGSELALTSREDNGLRAHVVDRSFIDDGIRWIVDYKSLFAGTDVDDATLRQQAETHRPQLTRYRGLFEDTGIPVRCAVFFTAHGRLIPLDDAPAG
ncbi:UvrD-helicase domain-containing protein [Denitratisoma sp. agr-D3]